MIGKTISHYKILEKVGQGGMGEVYKAEDTKLKRTVALKFLPPELTCDAEAKARFIHEAQAASALEHNNICNIHEIDETEDGQLFISMACYNGESLKDKIDRGPLKIEDCLDIVSQIARGLQKAHEQGIVHRDIKPANIAITEDGTAKILDFGLAKLAGRTMLTKEGTTLGTVAYMSPEQTQGTVIDKRTDIWTLGVILFEMLTGERPFKGEYDQAVLYSILNEEPDPISTIRSEISISIEQIVAKALEKNPDERYQQVEELLDDLKSVSAGIVPDEIKVRLMKAKLRRRKKSILYTGVAILITIIVVITLNLFTGSAGTIDSIAVLPLENLTGDAGQDYFVDGATDELIGQLAQISSLRVISRQSVMRYKESDKSLPEIARELNVDAVVEGTVYQVGESVRIRVQLINALPEEQNLWAQTYERAMNDVLVMYSEMAHTIADKIQINLTAEELTRLASARQVNPEAHEAYLKGMFHWYKLSPQNFETALQYFEFALEKEPDYALAHAGIALVWGGQMQMGFMPYSEVGQKLKNAAAKALALDSTLMEVYHMLAVTRTWYEWDWKGAETAYRRAIALNPNYPDTRAYFSHFLNFVGRPEESLVQIKCALKLDPFSSLFRALYGMNLNFMHQYDKAIKQLRKALKMAPNDPVAWPALRTAYHMKGMYKEVLEEWKTFYSVRGDSEAKETLVRGYSEDGYIGAMRLVAQLMEKRLQTTYVPPWQIGTLFTRAGQNDKALDWLEKAFEEHDANIPYLSVDPLFDILRSEPRFQDLLRKLNLLKNETLTEE